MGEMADYYEERFSHQMGDDTWNKHHDPADRMIDPRVEVHGMPPGGSSMLRDSLAKSMKSLGRAVGMHPDGYPVMVADENRAMMGSHDLEVGDIIRRAAGWTPMAVVGIKNNVVLACYCGDYFEDRITDCAEPRDSDGFVLVTHPEKELERCHGWRHRLNEEQHERLKEQVGMHKRKRKGKSTMKTRTELLNIAALTSNEVTTMVVLLDGTRGTKGLYTFLCKRTLAETITEEDTKVVVETKHGLTIGIVKEVHAEVTVETMDEYRMRWAFMKVAEAHLAQLNTWQEQVADKLNTAQRRVTKQSALQALGLGEDEVAALPALSPPAETTTE